MKYEVIKSCVIDRVARNKGEIVEVVENVNGLLGMGRIIPATESEIKVDRSVGLETSVEQPKRRGRTAK